MKNILLSVITTLIVVIVAGLIYIYSGSYNVSQMVPHKPITQWVINKTMQHSIEKRVKSIKVPALSDTTMIRMGAQHYNEMCVVCHGAPGHNPSELAEGLYPKPPRILKPEDVVPPAEAFWIIKFGIKMTGMPGFASTHTDEEIWAITAFTLNKLVKMTAEEFDEMVKE